MVPSWVTSSGRHSLLRAKCPPSLSPYVGALALGISELSVCRDDAANTQSCEWTLIQNAVSLGEEEPATQMHRGSL